jgi:hypothetical protein
MVVASSFVVELTHTHRRVKQLEQRVQSMVNTMTTKRPLAHPRLCSLHQ